MFPYAMDTVVPSDLQGNDDESSGVIHLTASCVFA